VRVDSGELLVGYYDEVHEQMTRYVEPLGEADLARIVDQSWDPPVTLGVRLVSVIADDLQHAGQAAFVRGILQRRQAEEATMINGAQAILYSDDAEATGRPCPRCSGPGRWTPAAAD
jgi:Protein of unknown function (DUF664)